MPNNIIAKTIRILGISIMALGILCSLIAGFQMDLISMAIWGSLSSLIIGILFLGLSEIIALLQDAADTQNSILDLLESKYNMPSSLPHCASGNRTVASKNLITQSQNTQSNAATVPYKCADCGTEGPYDVLCPNCNSTAKIFNN